MNFIDLCGHERYLKTTIFGLVGLCPDYGMIVIGANRGVTRMTKEHLGITLALKLPLFFVVTKIDIAPEDIYEKTKTTLCKILKSKSCNKKPVFVDEKEDMV